MEIISNFITKSDKYKDPFNLYYDTISNKNLPLENKFLNVIQATEWMYNNSKIYGRNCSGTDLISVKEIIGQIDSNYEKYFSIKEEKSLPQKLKGIEDYLGVKFEIDSKNIKNELVWIRNKLSHWAKKEDLDTKEFYNWYILLLVILEMFIIKELWIVEKLYKDILEHKEKLNLPL